MSVSRRLIAVLSMVLLVAGTSKMVESGQIEAISPPTRYTVSFPAPHTQMVEIAVEFDDVQAKTIDLSLPTWRPGRYVILDPAGTVRGVNAFDGATGTSLPVEKTEKSTWRITTGGAETVRVEYRIYANSLGDRTRHVDDTHAFLSGESVFMYWPKRRGEPLEVSIDAPDGWATSTGLAAHPTHPETFVAPNYDVLVDSPLEIGTHDRLFFEVDSTPHEIAIWGDADYDAQEMIDDFTEIVREQAAVFDDMPYEKYVFMIHAGRGAGGGTEHLNSTIMQTSRAALEDEDAYKGFLGLVSHEMFHTWNVKQLRPAGIHPYDYQRENYTKLLWMAEGTTSYYTGLILTRGELKKVDKYLDGLASSIDRHRRRPGREVQSLEESSFDAWIKFNRHTPDDVNSTVSFYSKGSLVSLMLDMEVRRRTANEISLDDVMRQLYEAFPLSGTGFTPDDLVTTLNEMTNSSFAEFYADHVAGTVELDFESPLDVVGLRLFFDPADDDDESESDEEPVDLPMKAYLGADTANSGAGARVRSVRSDGPAYHAGLMPGDEIVAMNGRRVNSSQIQNRIKDMEPGDPVTFEFFRYDQLREITITLGTTPDGKWKIERVEDPTDAQKVTYEDWLHHPWPDDDGDADEADELETES